MKLDKAIKIKEKYKYILQDASFPELIEADNLSIEALKRFKRIQEDYPFAHTWTLPGETPINTPTLSKDQIKKLRESPIGEK